MSIKSAFQKIAETERDNIRDIRITAKERKREVKTIIEKINPAFEKRALDYMEKALNEGADKGWVAEGLAGLDSEKAWEMRERLLREDVNKGWVARGIIGDYITFVWRIRYEVVEDFREEREPRPVRRLF